MIKKISIVTFISDNERINYNIFHLYKELKRNMEFCELIVFSDKPMLNFRIMKDENICQHIGKGMTKYKRILLALQYAKAGHVLFVDNDITPKMNHIIRFLDQCDESSDLCFGKIGVLNPQSFVQHLVKIDKIISHSIIRPTLWKLNIGISVPGQVFMVHKDRFYKDLKRIDTVFDDLTIGLCAKKNGYLVEYSKLILGYETASEDFATLFRQRIRWAKGFSETIINNADSKSIIYVLLHGAAYHLSTVSVDAILLWLLKAYPNSALFSLLVILGIISEGEMKELPFAACYMVVFPFIHLVWMIALINNLTHFNVNDFRKTITDEVDEPAVHASESGS